MTKVGGSNPFSTLASMVGFSKSSSSSSSSKVAELKSKFEALGTLTKASPRPANGTQDTNRLSDRLFRGHYTVPAVTASRVGGHLQQVNDNNSSSAANVAKRAAAHSSFVSANPGLQGASGSSSGGSGGTIADQVRSRGITARNFSDSNTNIIGSGSSSGSILDQVRSQGITARGLSTPSNNASGNASGANNVNDGASSRDYGANVRNARERFEAGPVGDQGESPGVKDAKEATKGVSVSSLRGIFEGKGGEDSNQVGRSSGRASGLGGAQVTGETQGTSGSEGLDGRGGVSGTDGREGTGGVRGTADGITSPGGREAQETIKNAGVSVKDLIGRFSGAQGTSGASGAEGAAGAAGMSDSGGGDVVDGLRRDGGDTVDGFGVNQGSGPIPSSADFVDGPIGGTQGSSGVGGASGTGGAEPLPTDGTDQQIAEVVVRNAENGHFDGIDFSTQPGGVESNTGSIPGTDLIVQRDITPEEQGVYNTLSDMGSWMDSPSASPTNAPESLTDDRTVLTTLLNNKENLQDTVPFPLAMGGDTVVTKTLDSEIDTSKIKIPLEIVFGSGSMYGSGIGGGGSTISSSMSDDGSSSIGSTTRKNRAGEIISRIAMNQSPGAGIGGQTVVGGLGTGSSSVNISGGRGGIVYGPMPNVNVVAGDGLNRLQLGSGINPLALLQERMVNFSSAQLEHLHGQLTGMMAMMQAMPGVAFEGASVQMTLPEPGDTQTMPSIRLSGFGEPRLQENIGQPGQPPTQEAFDALRNAPINGVSELMSQVQEMITVRSEGSISLSRSSSLSDLSSEI